eukprot:CAMPEP_0168554846 /NCGR_PEP_ID=MMETSP0413-20121227/8006_1 /TAXON_ID=136452 /ORGANISM="Filamoeba nolandi, Strain NC-AS-23-1" /LENGTH=248 /DNA_ID=CAMNT_0008585631 /DNA_START=259 /DNA_END=1005 /DNA_ORIENTATION=+
MNKLIPLVACALLFSTVSGLTFTGANCDTVGSDIFFLNAADLSVCQKGILLPSGISVSNPAPGYVQVLFLVYRCTFSFRSAFGLPATDTAIVANAGLGLSDFTLFDLGSSTNSARLAAAVQSAGFSLFFSPNIQFNIGSSSASASRSNFLPRGPDFSIVGNSLTEDTFGSANLTFVEFSNSILHGPRAASYNYLVPGGDYLQTYDACTTVIDGITVTDCRVAIPAQSASETFNVGVQSTAPLYVAQCS